MVFESADEPFAVTLLSLVTDVLLPNRRSNTIYVLILNTKRKTTDRRTDPEKVEKQKIYVLILKRSRKTKDLCADPKKVEENKRTTY